jgi:iron-sulfur cluster repair protein YtfE (RIC family)
MVTDKLIMDHKRVREYAEFLETLPKTVNSKNVWTKLEETDNFYKNNIKVHFSYEEECVFPLVLKSAEGKNKENEITRLVREHKEILIELKKYDELITDQIFPLKPEVIELLNVIIADLSRKLLEHALIEDNQIFPLFREQ